MGQSHLISRHLQQNAMHKFQITLVHDAGKIKITTSASSIQAAITIVCEAEGCPEIAIINIKRL
jgi:hypothetical protein